MGYAFGIDIGGTTVKMGFFQKEEGLLEKWEIATQKGNDPTVVLEDIKVAIYACLERHHVSKEDVEGIGMAAPGPVTEGGLLRGTVNIGWGDVYLGKEGERIFDISPVYIANDARVAALGEAIYGAGVGEKSMMLLTLGTGIGGGVVFDGTIHVGSTGVAGEIGHCTVDPYETAPCSCGKYGCLEQYASATGMVRVAKRFLAEEDMPSVLRDKENLTAKDLWDGVTAGDPLSLMIGKHVSRLLGITIANACYVVDPDLVVIGGGVSAAGEVLLDMVIAEYKPQVFPHSRGKKFALAKLRNEAGIYGAAALVFTV
ncbi:ROK family glucokinase [Chakrabartyella piscis]|uniref:ROK family glucokinase n=1 Tax=Chakrabartyella piscis TaxID=2918914 RepID=UPI00295846BC|nr:ROK family glucokinase [Chakrabartyella piscis]